MLLVEIVDHDEIEIGARRHFPGAEPAERDDRALAVADAAVRGDEIIFHLSVNGAQQNVGKPRESLAGLFRGHRAGKDPRADQEHVLLAEQPDGVEHGLVAAGLFAASGASAASSRFSSGSAAKKLGSTSGSMKCGFCAKISASRGAVPRMSATKRISSGILPQQRKKPAAGAQSGEKTVERRKSRIRIFRARELIDDDRNELGQIVARLLAAQRAISGRCANCRTAAATSCGRRKPICASRSSVSASAGPSTNDRCCWLASNSGARSNSRT